MVILCVSAAIHWGHIGNGQLKENWNTGLERGGASGAQILKQIYHGFSLGMLGLTGFECMPFLLLINLWRFSSSHSG
jgi:hypothetical protein